VAILMDWLINAAATAIGDPQKMRIQQPQWNTIASLALSDVCSLYDVLEYEDGFTIPADGYLTYPESCVRVSEIQLSLTPSTESSFRKLKEIFNDEWDRYIRDGVPEGDVADGYYADRAYIRLNATMAADVDSGGRIFYYATPPLVSDAASYVVPLPDFMRSYLVERLEIKALFADERTDESLLKERIWNGREDEIRSKIEHRAIDRREALRPLSAYRKYSGMA